MEVERLRRWRYTAGYGLKMCSFINNCLSLIAKIDNIGELPELNHSSLVYRQKEVR